MHHVHIAKQSATANKCACIPVLFCVSSISPHLVLILCWSPSKSDPESHLFRSLFASVFSYPDREQLQTIYSAYLQPVLQHSLGSQALWASTGKTHQLAGSLVQLYEQVWT